MADGYEFKLQRLLDIREKKEEEQKIIFMNEMNKKNKVEKDLENLQENLERYSQISNEMSTTDRKIQYQYMNLLNSTIDITKDKLKLHEKKVEKTRKDLVEAQVSKKIVSILKEKDKIKFTNEQNRIEQIQNDEFGLYGYMRKVERR